MKYPDKELQSCLEAFSSYSEDELIIKMQKTNPECAQHIAVKILQLSAATKVFALIRITMNANRTVNLLIFRPYPILLKAVF